jgi:hypothetical protein
MAKASSDSMAGVRAARICRYGDTARIAAYAATLFAAVRFICLAL